MRLLLPLLLASSASAAPVVERYALVANAEKIGALVVTTDGNRVDIDWAVDENGRGSKLKERIQLGPEGTPIAWSIEGKGWFGAPVKETFAVEKGKASWRSLDDSGESTAPSPLYLPNNGSPWAQGLCLRLLLRAKDQRRVVLPGGELRLETLREVNAGGMKATAHALWGLDMYPTFLLGGPEGRFVGAIAPGWVLIEEKFADRFGALSKLAAELSAEALERLTRKVTHRYPGPLWVKNVRVFDAAAGTLTDPRSVVVFGDRIAGVRTDAPPADAVVIDGAGGTLLPGLWDLHAHASDWSGPLHLASGVTSTRDPGNDNDVLLALADKIESGALMGPRIERAGFLEGRTPFSARTGIVVDKLESALSAVRWYADHGYSQIKIYNSMTPAWVKPIAAEAHRLKLRVSGHVPAFMTSEQAVRDGYDEINHINQLVLSFVIGPKDDTRTPFRFTALGERTGKLDLKSASVQRMVKLMKERGTTLDPTMQVFQALLLARPGKTTPNDAPWLDHAPVSVRRSRRQQILDLKPEQFAAYEASWKRLKEILLLLHTQGIRLVPGTDDAPGLSLHSELAAWAEAGIENRAILTSATLGAARYLGRAEERGSIERGKLADLLLVDGDPTKDIAALRKVRAVFKGGAVYFPAEIHGALGVLPFAPAATVTVPAR